ncbi:endopeptidase La [Thiobacillus sp.]|uniref:endopeptidase La n=1 Tax=Thiobacillus sp. TaxID=924 RepID=UPI00286D7517|nr:endopeptidase La [Thiobacillus sp.]
MPHSAAPEGEPSVELQLPVDPLLPNELYLLPLTEKPFFPAQTMPLLMNEAPWLTTVEAIGESSHHMVGLVVVKPDNTDEVKRVDFRNIGTLVRIHHPVRSDGKMQFIAEGRRRFRIVEWLSETAPFKVRVDYPNETGKPESEEIRAYSIAIINTIKDLLPLNPLYSEELKFFLNRFGPNEPSQLTDFAASLTTASKQALQDVLEAFALKKRMEKVLVLLKKELDVARLQSDIRDKVDEKMSEQQREFFLRQQLKAIQKELGIAKDDKTAELDTFNERIAKLKLPDPARKRIDEEMHKLALLETGSPEYSVTRNYLDWLTVLPWGVHTQDKIDLDYARKILDRDHDGLDDVKDRIIEFLAVGAMRGEMAGSILLLIGPPGVGKTSIGKSIAETLGRKFYRFSVGGMRDEAEIKGHRRTYIGAMPGKFVQALKEVGSANPVIMLDEIDKIGANYQGDPASALLEVLDPEQNADFLDHYLDVRFDLSKALFICTANGFSIPSALLDRMEVIRLSGYITEEKIAIAKHHLWPRVLSRAGLKKNQLTISEGALRHVIDGYAREAGVRNLEKQLGRVARKAVVKILGGAATPIKIGIKEVEAYLDKPVFTREKPMSGVGIVTGLAWTAMGGTTLPVEASRIHGLTRGFKLTGKLGDVMKESAEIAYSFVVSNLKTFAVDDKYFDSSFIHLHVPEGATPKDGPSAGITMATALLSLAKKAKISRPLAMTGELTLTGQVLPVGGIREKVIAARRVGITELILPDANRRDFDKLPDHIREGLTVHFAKRYQDVATVVFGTPAA